MAKRRKVPPRPVGVDVVTLARARARDVEDRSDGWVNKTTMGSAAFVRERSVFLSPRELSDRELEELYRSDDLAARIVSEIVDERMRQGFKLTGDPDGELAAAVDRYCVSKRVTEAAYWGRLFGGGAVFLWFEGHDHATPLREEDIRPGSLTRLMTFDKTELTPQSWVTDFADPRFGEPETYLLTLSHSGGSLITPVIHASRLVMFGGAVTTRRVRNRRQGWDDSVLQRCWTVLRDVGENWQSAVHLMKNLSQWVYKVKDLAKMVAAGERERLQQLMEDTDMRRSVFRGLMIDAQHEDVASIPTANVTAIPDILQQTWMRLASAAGMPLTRLMGMSPAGLNATGESDLANWYSVVEAYGEREILPALRTIIRAIALSEGLPNINVDELDITFPSLWQLDPKETAELRKMVAETDAIYIQNGVLLGADVALSRWGQGEWSMETAIDENFREEMRKLEEERLADLMERGELPGEPAPEDSGNEVA